MSPTARRALTIALILATIPSFFVFRTWVSAGGNTTLTPMFEGECTLVEGPEGVVDLARVGADVVALGVEGGNARLWRIAQDGEATDAGVIEDLAPTGFDAGGRRVGVVGIQSDGAAAIAWARAARGAPYAQTRRALLEDTTAPRDLALGQGLSAWISDNPRAAIATGAHRLTGGHSAATGRVRHVSAPQGGEPVVRTVAEGLQFADGLTMNGNGARLAVAETTGRGVSLFRVEEDGALTRSERVFLGTHPLRGMADDALLVFASAPKVFRATLKPEEAWGQVALIDQGTRSVDQAFLWPEGGALRAAVVDGDRRWMTLAYANGGVASCALPETWRHSQAFPARRPQGRTGS